MRVLAGALDVGYLYIDVCHIELIYAMRFLNLILTNTRVAYHVQKRCPRLSQSLKPRLEMPTSQSQHLSHL